MGDVADLVSILIAIDDAVSANSDLRATVADLVPAYRDDTRVGWATGFRDRLGDEEQLAPVEEAVANLDQATLFANLLPRRLLAIAVLARVFPGLYGPHGEQRQAMHDALMTPGLVEGLGVVPTPPTEHPPEVIDRSDPLVADRAKRLLVALADPTDLRRLEDWNGFLQRHAELVSSQLARLPTPCSTSVVELPTLDGLGPIALLQTDLCVGDVPLSQVVHGFLHPENWAHCNAWWCEMTPEQGAVPPLRRFREVVALNCDPPVFAVDVLLDFADVVTGPTRTVVTYNMSPGQSGLAVDVDRGVIDVRTDGDHVRVRTTKRVRFTTAVDMAAVAMIACWVGYGEAATDLICNCSGGTPRALDCSPASPFGAAIDRLVALAHACVADVGAEARRIADRAETGSFGVGPADAFRLVPLAVRGWGKLATAAAEAIGGLTTTSTTTTTVTTTPLGTAAVVERAGPFSFAPPLPEECDLELAGPLRSPYPGEQADQVRVTFVPGRIRGADGFSLDVRTDGLEGTAYLGQVQARSRLDGLVKGLTDVDVVVP